MKETTPESVAPLDGLCTLKVWPVDEDGWERGVGIGAGAGAVEGAREGVGAGAGVDAGAEAGAGAETGAGAGIGAEVVMGNAVEDGSCGM